MGLEFTNSPEQDKHRLFKIQKEQMKGVLEMGDYDGWERMMQDKKDELRLNKIRKNLKRQGKYG